MYVDFNDDLLHDQKGNQVIQVLWENEVCINLFNCMIHLRLLSLCNRIPWALWISRLEIKLIVICRAKKIMMQYFLHVLNFTILLNVKILYVKLKSRLSVHLCHRIILAVSAWINLGLGFVQS